VLADSTLAKMADFPPPEKVAGPYVPQFEIYWKKLDPDNTGKVAPMVAAQFLKLSGLSDQTLGKVWELSDPDGRGYLDKTGVFVACKLVALSQSSKELLTESLLDPSPAPNFGAATAPGAEVAEAPRGTPAPSINFLVKPDEKRKYDTLFDQLKPVSGLLPGDKVRNVMMGSKLPMSMLGKIWDLADQDKDGSLDRYEFTVAMHLVYRALQGDMIPDQLPTELGKDKVPQPLSTNINMAELNVSYNGAIARPGSRSGLEPSANPSSGLPPMVANLPPPIANIPPIASNLPSMASTTIPPGSSTLPLMSAISNTLAPASAFPHPLTPTLSPSPSPLNPTSAVQAVPWVVNAGDRLRYKALFEQTDNDKDGFISGVEIKNVFLQTGLPQNILAHIWNLCDMRQEGKLNPEQFALAMYLVQQKQAGKDPPAQLTPDMVPPSMRPKGEVLTGQAGGSSKSVYQNPELEAMAKEIQELLQEKMALERGVQEQEYIISAKSTETHSLQAEFDTLNSTLTQLTNQKNIAQKRLDDLDGQKASMGTDLQELDSRISEEEKKIGKLREQAEEQESSLKAQEEEVNCKKRELEVLVEEEAKLGADIKKSQREIESLIKGLKDVEDLLNETTTAVTDYTGLETHLKDATVKFSAVIGATEGDDALAQNVPDIYLDPINLSFAEHDYS